MKTADEGYIKTWDDVLQQEVWRAPSTVSGFLTPQMFGGRGDGVSRQLTSDDIAAHTEWLGTYDEGTEWDVVGWQEMLFACYGAPGSEHTSNSKLNLRWEAPAGNYLINRPLTAGGVQGFRGGGMTLATKLLWTGSDPDATLLAVNGLAYGDFEGLTFEAAQECYALFQMDYDGVLATLRQQNFTLRGMTFHQNGLARFGWEMNRVSSSSGQGDTIVLDRVSEYGSPAGGAGFKITGSNALLITCINGDSQDHAGHGVWLDAAHINFIDKHFESGGIRQIRNRSFDIYAPNAIYPVKVSGCRSESACLSWGVADLENCSAEAGVGSPPFFTRIDLTPYRFGHVVGHSEPTGKGRAYIQIASDPPTTAYFDIVAPFSTTVVKVSGASFTTNEHAGRRVQARYPNGFSDAFGTVVSNTSDMLTLSPGLPFLPGDVPGNSPFEHTSVRVLLTDFPTTGAAPPDWAEVSSAFYWGAYGDPSEGLPGVTMEEGSDIVELASSSLVGNFAALMEGMTALVQGAGVDGIDLASEVVEWIDATHIRLADEASTAVENTPCRIGTTVTDGTAVWLHFEYYAVVNARSMKNVRVGFGQVFSKLSQPVDYDNVESWGGHGGEARTDWLNEFILKSVPFNASTFKHCSPCETFGDSERQSLDVGSLRTHHTQYDRTDEGGGTGQRFPGISAGPDERNLLPAGNVYGIAGGGLKLAPFTLEQIEAVLGDVEEGTFWFCSDAKPGTSPAEDGGAGTLVVYAGGMLLALGATPPLAPPSAGLILHVMADTLTLSDTDPVATWPDASGGGFDLAQATSGSRPVFRTGIQNGLPVVRFDGTDDYLSNASLLSGGNFPASEATMFLAMVMNFSAGDSLGGFVATGSATDEFGRFSDGNGYSAYFRSARINTYPSPMPHTGPHLMTVKSGTGAGTYDIRLNGVSQGAQNPSWGIRSVFEAGRSSHSSPQYFMGDFCEILVYDTALTDEQIEEVETYLNEKWALY